MLKKAKNGIEISIAEPTQKLTQIKLTLRGNYNSAMPFEIKKVNGISEIVVILPKGDEAGKSVNMILNNQI